MTTYTNSFDTHGTSSVIDEVFYNSETEELYVQLAREDWMGNKVIAGYAGVPQDIYDAMELINNSRVNEGNTDASVGSYWNIFVKPNFSGIDTNGVELEPVFEPDDEAVSFFTSSTADVEVEEAPGVEEVETEEADQQELLSFVLTFDSLTTEGELAVFATGLEDAIARFDKIAEIAGLEDAYVLSATVHFL